MGYINAAVADPNFKPDRKPAVDPKKAKSGYNRKDYLNRRKKDPFSLMLRAAKARAKKKGLEFDITKEFLESIAPDTCPILGFKLDWSGPRVTTPSLDRINSTLGYTKDNVQIISARANDLKRDATLEELELLGHWARSQI